jgi:hypothetical protein
MRCPSEVLNLKWSDVDWDKGRLRIDAKKTGLRFCPLFPEVREILSEAFELAPEGAVYVIDRYRDEQSLRTQFARILNRAGIKPWPKLFHNLRSSRRTELQEIFPSHVIDSWLGHSTKVAEMHYLQVTDEHWERASGSHAGSHIKNNSETLKGNHDTKKPSILPGSDGLRGVMPPYLMPPQGLEPMANSQGNLRVTDSVPPPVPPSTIVTGELAKLIELWNGLDEPARRELMVVAGELAKGGRSCKGSP